MTAVEVMLVAVWHFEGSEADAVSNPPLDVATPRRQAELDEAVGNLAGFSPTKVAVEHPVADQARLDAAYAAHIEAGARRRSEVDQLGFRLAAHLGHDRVHAIDVSGDFYEPSIEELLVEAAHRRRWDECIAMARRDMEKLESILEESTVGAALAALNQPDQRHRSAGPYYDGLLAIADPATGRYSGPDMVANFYRRNLRIAATVCTVSEPGDRVIVLIGLGHVPFLAQIFESTGNVTLVDPLPYLDRA